MALITLIHFRQIVFRNTLQGVILLLAEKQDKQDFTPLIPHNTPQLSLFDSAKRQYADLQVIDLNNVEDLQNLNISKVARHSSPPVWDGHWMLALLNDDELRLLDRLQKNKRILTFETIAEVDIGIVTGANKFFAVSDTTLNQYQLEKISSPMLAKSDLIKGISYTVKDHETNRLTGKDVHFLHFPEKPIAELPPKMVDYIKWGELQDLHTRYKCRIRSPWYVVPYVWVSEVALLKRCHRFPRLVLNELGAHSTDTAYRIKMKPTYKNHAKNLVFSFLNSLTFLYAELLGRHYGGGVLELVPSEIEELRIPLISVNNTQFSKVDEMIRANTDLDTLLDYTDMVILKDGIGLSEITIEKIRTAHKKLMLRRLRVTPSD
jgi:adenine-specific DNA methylase